MRSGSAACAADARAAPASAALTAAIKLRVASIPVLLFRRQPGGKLRIDLASIT
jgi:hypothetical protein